MAGVSQLPADFKDDEIRCVRCHGVCEFAQVRVEANHEIAKQCTNQEQFVKVLTNYDIVLTAMMRSNNCYQREAACLLFTEEVETIVGQLKVQLGLPALNIWMKRLIKRENGVKILERIVHDILHSAILVAHECERRFRASPETINLSYMEWLLNWEGRMDKHVMMCMRALHLRLPELERQRLVLADLDRYYKEMPSFIA